MSVSHRSCESTWRRRPRKTGGQDLKGEENEFVKMNKREFGVQGEHVRRPEVEGVCMVYLRNSKKLTLWGR